MARRGPSLRRMTSATPTWSSTSTATASSPSARTTRPGRPRRSTPSWRSTRTASASRSPSRPATTSTRHRSSAPTASASRGRRGITRTCRGTEARSGSASSTATATSSHRARLPAVTTNRCCSRNGRRRASCTSSPTATIGGTSIARAVRATSPCAAVTPSSARRSGFSDSASMRSPAQTESAFFTLPKRIEFPTEPGLTAHAISHPPRNQDHEPPAGEKPPLVVHCHGGPTGSAGPTYPFEYQYWTSRGLALVDVNYGGSTGYGRAYRQRLNGNWGVVDVDDCINAARHLVDQGLADPDRVSITGGSAGGFTALLSLTKRDFYNAGASHYGIGDLELFVKETHKFESHYGETLTGPYPHRADVYRERSAIHFADQMRCPVILFQGDEDMIVPPDQAETFVEACRRNHLPYAYVLFQGEQQGFRQDKNIRRAFEGELSFLAQVFGFEPADDIEPVKIENR